MKTLIAFCLLLSMTLSAAANPANDVAPVRTQKVLTEAQVQMMSDHVYGWMLSQSLERGWRFTPEQIASGYRHHFEELKLRLINEGYEIVTEDVEM